MDALQPLLATSNWEVIKEPRGFMKCLQFIFTICAFATTTSFSSTFSFLVTCANSSSISTVTGTVHYDFRLDQTLLTQEVCGKAETINLFGNASSDSQFFVAIGVLSWLFVMAALVMYTVFHNTYAGNQLIPLLDCGFHGVLAVLWLAAGSAWANSLRLLKTATAFPTLQQENAHICQAPGQSCQPNSNADYGKLDISIILGFLNMFLFASNIWFLYKETAFFKGPQMPPQAPSHEVPPATAAAPATWPATV